MARSYLRLSGLERRMIVILNGCTGVGKTAVARKLIGYFERAVMLDGDHVCSVHPPDPEASDYRAVTIRTLATHHRQHGYRDLVIHDLFRVGSELARLRRLLADADDEIQTFRLTCSESALRRRLQAARAPDVEHLLRQSRAEHEALEDAARGADMGLVVDTSAMGAAQVAEAIWQILREEVTLSPHSESWRAAFDAEKPRIAAALGDLAVNVHHVGSTAVPGLVAKPVIDIMVVVRKLDDAVACIAPLRALGYTFVDYPQNHDRRFFRKGFPRTHHLHVVEEGGATLTDHLEFRDALRARPDWRDRYARFKTELAARYARDRARYGSSKWSFVQEALREYRGQPLHPLAE